MSSFPRRDPTKDHLLTPENAALIIIDYQPTQVDSINSINSMNSMNRADTVPGFVGILKEAGIFLRLDKVQYDRKR
jgi:hypothetical protein